MDRPVNPDRLAGDQLRALYSDDEVEQRALFHIRQARQLIEELRERRIEQALHTLKIDRPLLHLAFTLGCLDTALTTLEGDLDKR